VTVERGNEPAGSEAGLWHVSEFSKSLNAIETVLAEGTWGDSAITSVSITAQSDRSVVVKANGTILASFTFADDDEYYDPSGKAGAYVGGADPLTFVARPSVIVSQYQVTDTAI
jgi:hypothetical protein